MILSSWKNNDDPSLKALILLRLMLRVWSWFRHNSVLECSGSWNGVGFGGVPSLNSNSLYRCALTHKDTETYFTYCANVTSILVWPNQDGIVQRLTWIDRMNDRNVHSGAPGDTCESYAFCGAYGRCIVDQSPVCWCLERFVLNNQNEWERAGWSSGCVQRTPLNCHNGDGSVKYSNS
jgi:hypothetical protein